MVTRYIDGHDYLPVGADLYSTANKLALADGWYGLYGQAGAQFMTTGRFGVGSALRLSNLGNDVSPIKALGTRITGGYVIGFAVTVYPGGSVNSAITFRDGTTNSNTAKVSFSATGVTTFTVNGVTYSTAVGAMRNNSWNYIQIKHTPDGLWVLVNGELQIYSTSAGAPKAIDSINYFTAYSTASVAFDDLYINDLNGPTNTDFLGNVVVRAQLPVSNGDTIQLTPNGNASNYQNVSDYTMNVANYNNTPTVGNFDLYNMNPNVSARDIFAIQLKAAMAQDNGVQLYGASQIKTNGTVYTGPQFGLSQLPGYKNNDSYWDLNPDSGVAWTTYDLNHIQAGPLLKASD